MCLHYNVVNSYLFVNGKQIYKFKANNKDVNLPAKFFVGSISNKFDAIDFKEVSLRGIVYDFSVDYNSIDITLTF